MYGIKVTKILVVVFLSMSCFIGSCQFNTVKNSNVKGTVSMLALEPSDKERDSLVKRDSVVSLLQKKKVEYNMGMLPLDSIIVTSPYGMRVHPMTGVYSKHNGIDLRAKNKKIHAVQLGYISETGYDEYLGGYVKAVCGSFEFIYGHLKHIYVKEGQLVTMGAILGATGGTGKVTAEHLHFSIKDRGEYIDPYPILKLIYDNLDVDILPAGDQFQVE